ncbi:MAG: CRISPR-associated endonuclease Cas1 [Saprospiraceae bacterium]|nr:CRISPR-associated endonuclease Cas1 [Saprospiraceae bacterium]
MQLYLDSFGAFLAVRQGMFLVRTRHAGERAFAVRELQAILLTRATGMSTDALLLAVEHDIPVLLIDPQTHFPLAQLSSGRPGSIASIRKNQAFFTRSAEGYAWVGAQLADKVAAQRQLLQSLAEHRAAAPGFRAELRLSDRVLAAMEAELRRPPLPAGATWDEAAREATAGRYRGQEGTASRLYFQHLAKFLAAQPPAVGATLPAFEGRQKRPAYDPFNALLNYLYGMLYTNVHLAVLKAGLDPYLGILHADRYGAAPTLVFDAIEPFRPWADAVALDLFLGGTLDAATAFEQRNERSEGLWLSAAGKDRLIDAMLAHLEAPAGGPGTQWRRRVLIDHRARQLAALLLDAS